MSVIIVSCSTRQVNSFFQVFTPENQTIVRQNIKIPLHVKCPFLRMCPSENCQGIIPVIENHPFECIQCQKQFCRKCMYLKHDGKCTKNEAVILNMKYNYCKCKCEIIVEKTEACDHMTCICGRHFCYKCGKMWNGTTVHNCSPVRRQTGTNQNNRNQSEDSVLRRYLRFAGNVIRTIVKICFIGIYFMVILTMMLSALIMGLKVGIFFFSFYCIYEKCINNQLLTGAALLLFFPIAIIMGIYYAYQPQGIVCITLQHWWNSFMQVIDRPFDEIWQ